jgi:hypothetical protein
VPRLEATLRAWNTPEFGATLKREVAGLGSRLLPLQQAVSTTSVALDTPVTVVLHEATETTNAVIARIGVFFEGVVTGCSCADDPNPIEPQNEYCEFDLAIDKGTAETTPILVD